MLTQNTVIADCAGVNKAEPPHSHMRANARAKYAIGKILTALRSGHSGGAQQHRYQGFLS